MMASLNCLKTAFDSFKYEWMVVAGNDDSSVET